MLGSHARWCFEHGMNWENGHESALELAVEHSNRAVALDGQSPMAQAVLGWMLLYKQDDVGAVIAAQTCVRYRSPISPTADCS